MQASRAYVEFFNAAMATVASSRVTELSKWPTSFAQTYWRCVMVTVELFAVSDVSMLTFLARGFKFDNQPR